MALPNWKAAFDARALSYFLPTLLLIVALVTPLLVLVRPTPQPTPAPVLPQPGIDPVALERNLESWKGEMVDAVKELYASKGQLTPEQLQQLELHARQMSDSAAALKSIRTDLKADLQPHLESFDASLNRMAGQLNSLRGTLEQMKKGAEAEDIQVIGLHSDLGLDLSQYLDALVDLFGKQTFRQQYQNYRLGLCRFTDAEETQIVPLDAGLLLGPIRIGAPAEGSTDRLEAVGSRLPALFPGSKGLRRVVLLVSANTPPPPAEKRDDWKQVAVDAVVIGPAQEQKHLPDWLAFCAGKRGSLVWLHASRRAPEAGRLDELKEQLRRLVHPQLVRN